MSTATGAHHIALLGDSIFDNGRYTGGEPDVVTHLRAMLSAGWTATLCAIDGSVASTVAAQAEFAKEYRDVIYRTANELSVSVLELRRVCTEPSDYANPIEPSGSGGRKIARAILARLGDPGPR